jgi:hypothetical protein
MLQRYQDEYDNDDGPQEICDQGETLADAIERITEDAKKLADSLGEQVKYLATRHKLAVEMAKLEDGAATPLKSLEKRVAVLQQVTALTNGLNHRLGFDAKSVSLEALKERVTLIETINRLEPGEVATPIKKLRERARLLERIETASEVEGEDA